MQITIRDWCKSDTAQLFELFLQTVRQVNINDYTEQQIAAWASESLTLADWQSRMGSIKPYVAWHNSQIVGYADLQQDGLIDHFFIHHAYQRRGVGKALMQHIHQQAQARQISRLYAHVSKTAKPFFCRWGFELITQQTVTIRGTQLTNFLMQKQLVDGSCAPG